VPPRSFYGRTPPANLITVPACEACNSGFGQLDDYARFVLITTENKESRTRKDLIPTVRRYAEREESSRQLAKFYESLETGLLRNDAGVFVERQMFEVEGAKMDAFAIRVIKALFYRESGRRLPAGYVVKPIHYRQIPELDARGELNREFFVFIMERLQQSARRRQWGDVFGYSWVQWPPDDVNATWWLLSLYDKAQYVCSTWSTAMAGEGPGG
jgi:hypothetical protein